MAELKQIAETLVNLTVKEVNELAAILKDEYGIEPAAAAPVMVAGGGGASGGAAHRHRRAGHRGARRRHISPMAQREADAGVCAASEHGINAADGQGLGCPQQDAPVIGLGAGQPDHLGRHRSRWAEQ